MKEKNFGEDEKSKEESVEKGGKGNLLNKKNKLLKTKIKKSGF
jgi:hypothetical protein